jgi:hypothetical protein
MTTQNNPYWTAQKIEESAKALSDDLLVDLNDHGNQATAMLLSTLIVQHQQLVEALRINSERWQQTHDFVMELLASHRVSSAATSKRLEALETRRNK